MERLEDKRLLINGVLPYNEGPASPDGRGALLVNGSRCSTAIQAAAAPQRVEIENDRAASLQPDHARLLRLA